MIRSALRPVVLVAEDSDEDFDTLSEARSRAGVATTLERASSGEQCLARLRELDRAPAPLGLVLLDLNLPGLDGRGVLAEIRSDPARADVPVVVLSTSASPQDVSYCYQLGANAFHVKPVQYGEHLALLVDLLAYWLGRVVLPSAAVEGSS